MSIELNQNDDGHFVIKSELWHHPEPNGESGEAAISSTARDPETPSECSHCFPGQEGDFFETRLLLFTGVMKPRNAFSFWWLCYVGWRFLVALTCCLIIREAFFLYRPPVLVFWFFAPLLLANVTAASMWAWLPKIIRRFEKSESLSPNELRRIKMIPKYFILLWLVFAFIIAVSRVITTGMPYLFLLTFCMESSTTSILGCMLYALAYECAIAKKATWHIADLARKQTLDCEQYKKAASGVLKQSEKWKGSLFFLSIVALYCTAGIVVSISFLYGKSSIFHTGDDDIVSTIELDIIIITELIKETVVLFLMMQLVMEVNSGADAVVTVLLSNPWGEAMAAAEITRSHLLWLSTSYPVTLSSESSWWGFLFDTGEVGRISFFLLGVRVSRPVMLGLFLSIIFGVSRNVGHLTMM